MREYIIKILAIVTPLISSAMHCETWNTSYPCLYSGVGKALNLGGGGGGGAEIF